MTSKRSNAPTFEAKQSLLRALLASLAFVGVAAVAATSASAGLTGDVVGGATGSVPKVDVPTVDVPTVDVPAPPPPPPVAVPDAPQVPDVPQAPVKSPSKPSGTPPVSSPSPSPPLPSAGSVKKAVDPVTGTAAAGGSSGAPKKAVDTVAGGSKEAVKQVTSTAGGGGSVKSGGGHGAGVPSAEAGFAGDGARAPGTAPRKLAGAGPAASIRSARVAPLQRYLARVWPAIALVRSAEARARLAGEGPLTLGEVARLLLMGGVRASASGGNLASASSEQAGFRAGQAAPDDRPSGPNNSLVPGGREITFFVIFSIAALLALLISTLWMEVRSKYLYR